MADDDLTAEEREAFRANFEKLKDGPDEKGKFERRAIPEDAEEQDLIGPVKRAIAQLTVDQRDLLISIAQAGKAHIFLYDHEETKGRRGKVVAMGL